MKSEKFITDFCGAIDQCHGQRPDKLWFSTWMSSKSPYFSFPQSFEKFWLSNKLPSVTPTCKKLSLAFRLTVTLGSVLAKSIYLKFKMRQELQEISALRNKKVNLLRTFSYGYAQDAKDPFWGELVEVLTQSSVPLITIYDPHFSVTHCKNAYNSARHNLPYLIFVSPVSLFRNYFLILFESFKKINFQSYQVKNIDIKTYLADAYQAELLSPTSFVNLVFYESFKKTFNEFDIQKAYIPFENNPWEKMFHLAKLSSRKKFEIIGFQHASIQEGATNYHLSSYENHNRLCPDKILSVGEYTFKYMQSLPYYKNIHVQIGCALRYSYLENETNSSFSKSDENINLLVILDGTLDTVKLIELVLNFTKINTLKNISIKFKEHPNLRIKKFFPDLLNNEALLSGKITLAQGSLQENLEVSDIVLYTGTTSSIEALKMGKGAINYNFSMFNYDPLFQFTDFKWKASTPEELIDILQSYQQLSPEELAQKKLAAKNFVNKYFSPCTRENIERFL